MNDFEKLARAFQKLVGENEALKARLVEVERNSNDKLAEFVQIVLDRFSDVDATHQRAMEGINEVLAGHEVALIGLGAAPEPVRVVVDATTSTDIDTPVSVAQTEVEATSIQCTAVHHEPIRESLANIDLGQWPDLVNSNMPPGVIRQLIRQRQSREDGGRTAHR